MFPQAFLEERAPQMGVPGTGRSAFVGVGSVPPLFVNQDHPSASDNNMGQSPDTPFETIQAAIDAAVDNQSIYIQGGSIYEELIEILVSHADNISLIGLDVASLRAPAASASPVITSENRLNLHNLVFFNSLGGSDGVAIVEINDTFCKITGCRFVGNDAETVALSPGAGAYTGWLIEGNRFLGGGVTTSDALLTGAGAIQAIIRDNLFTRYESIAALGDCSNAIISGNRFGLFATTGLLEASTTPGAMVTDNYFSGTYSIAGGYSADADSHWVGNFIPGGITTADPA